MKKSEQDIIAECIDTLFESDLGDGYSKVEHQTFLARGQAKIYHNGKFVGKVVPKYAMGDEDSPDRPFIAIGLEHDKDGSHKEVHITPKNHSFDGAVEALKAHHKKQKIGEFVN